MRFVDELEKKYLQTSDSRERVALDKQHVAYLEKQIQKHPRDTKALIYYGVLSWTPFHDEQKAFEYLKRVITIDPKNTDAYFWLATVYYHECYYKEAEQIAIEALKIDSNQADCLYRLAIVIDDYYRDVPRAIQYAQQAVDQAPDCPSYVHFLTALLAKTRHIQAAEFYLEKFIELSKRPPVKIRNGVEYYYETIVTWRGGSDNKECVQRLIDRIDAAKRGIPYIPPFHIPKEWLEEKKKNVNQLRLQEENK